MANDESHGTIKVSAHVLVQLGEELVTDVEQAILECVKNAYDADSKGCVVTVDTSVEGKITQSDTAANLARFNNNAENVSVQILDELGLPYRPPASEPTSVLSKSVVQREITWKGRITIEDRGVGLNEDQLRNSWLVISGSSKRSATGQKAKTEGGRTPLGDKGVGRLGSMKLGDVLLIETAKSESAPLGSAAFRWADCEVAATVDEIPVQIKMDENTQKFKGTRISVLGLKDIEQWKGPERSLAITKSLAKLISPFEAQSKFPVVVEVDGLRQSLVAMTDTLLSRAVAQFEFTWGMGPEAKGMELTCRATFRQRLFRPTGGSAKQRLKADVTFEDGTGEEFLHWMVKSSKLRRYALRGNIGEWFLEARQVFRWENIVTGRAGEAEDPGEFKGSWYYFNLLEVGKAGEREGELDNQAAAGLGIDKALVKDMAGVTILRDGFRVRSPGDWLGVSSGMTSGSTYGLRFDNTVGYFALTGEHNYGLVEKSDREGFVDNASFRGFFQVAGTCRNFANDVMEAVRRAQDEYVAAKLRSRINEAPRSAERSIDLVEKTVAAAGRIQDEANALREALELGLTSVSRQLKDQGFSDERAAASLATLRSAVDQAKKVSERAATPEHAATAVGVIRSEIAESKERMLSLYESAAVGLSARGMTHDLRAHIFEIRKRATAIEALTKAGKATTDDALPHLRAIRASCSSIAAAAALIDPLLPRTRAVKESIDLAKFAREYFDNRANALELESIEVKIEAHASATMVRMNRGRLLAILDNLVRNSVYWLRRGEQVLRIKRAKKIVIAITRDGFTLSDTGPGVDPSYEDTIFDMFVSAKPASERGQGLGLFIVSQLLAADGGSIALAPERNTEGRHNKFVVNLASVIQGAGAL